MNPQNQLQLEDAQKKLAVFRKHLNLLARCTEGSQNVQKEEILSAVAELEALVQWAAQQPDLGAVSAVLLVKIQELHQIRENLEKTSAIPPEYSASIENDKEKTNLANSENCCKDIECVVDSTHMKGVLNIVDDHVYLDKELPNGYSASVEDPNVATAESPQNIEDTNIESVPSDDKFNDLIMEDEKDNTEQIMEQEISFKGKEVFHETPEVPTKIKSEVLELQPKTSVIGPTDLYRSEVIIIETDEDNKSAELINHSPNSTDPLDVCMYAIRNLYESLRIKENELLKLSTMRNDQKHIEALQAVIVDFHKDITNLNFELENYKKENIILKEQVLELEEAENDARLEAQKLEQKLVFLQEKDSHSQAELSQLKQTLTETDEALAEKEVVNKEFRSEIKYLGILVQQYEDQIKILEAKLADFAQKDIENKEQQTRNLEKPLTHNRGTQTYPPPRKKFSINEEAINYNNDNRSTENMNSIVTSAANVLENSNQIVCEGTAQNPISSISMIPLTLISETADVTEQSDFVNIENVGSISEKELLKRLHKLIDEDVSLQQQIHYVDEINLALWKKLQKLDNHIGECKRQNINETNPLVTEVELKVSSAGNSNVDAHEASNTNTNDNIPLESFGCIDRNEQYIQERLRKLEEINATFEKELKTRENTCQEKEKYEKWMETEKRVLNDLNRLAEEKDWIANQVTSLEKEIEIREKYIMQREQSLITLKRKNQEEIYSIRADQSKMIEPFTLRVNGMLFKEKEILKMITNLKSKEDRCQGRIELERLKCSYIELQLELSQAREEMRKIEEKYNVLLDQCANKHLSEESERVLELERLRNENAKCKKILNNLQKHQKDLMSALEKQTFYLKEVRRYYKKDVEESGAEQRSAESELESQLRHIEEKTRVTAIVLREERLEAEKELQKNIEDLKAKEDFYKAKIAELERDVINLHDELHKMASDSVTKKNAQEPRGIDSNKATENIIDNPKFKTEGLRVIAEALTKSETEVNSKTSKEISKEQSSLTIKDENMNYARSKESLVEEFVQENVDELRAQVRKLQSHIEKISEEVAELPIAQPPKPITASSLKMQKVEDIDYAEVEECCYDAWKKQNVATSTEKAAPHQNTNKARYSTELNDKLKNEKSSNETDEENDYDEVLPRPTNFHVVQQVGPDTLLVGWNYVNPSVLDGFEVYLNEQVHERIYIPDRTKYLISGLNLRKPVRLSIFALSRYGQMSEPAVLELTPQENFNNYFDDEEDEYRDFEDPMKQKRPYSMEW